MSHLIGMIWRRVPKTVFVGSDLFKIGVYDAVAHFNMGEKAAIKVLEAMGLNPGSLTKAGVTQPRTQALHCFYRDQRRLIIQARKGARSTCNEGSAWQKMQIFVVTYRISCF